MKRFTALHDATERAEGALNEACQTLLYALDPRPHCTATKADAEQAVTEAEAACAKALEVLRKHRGQIS